jgi:hypothetical protein
MATPPPSFTAPPGPSSTFLQFRRELPIVSLQQQLHRRLVRPTRQVPVAQDEARSHVLRHKVTSTQGSPSLGRQPANRQRIRRRNQ